MRALELREEMKSTYLVQRLSKGHGGAVDNPFSFGGGFQNGGFNKEFMDVIRPIFEFDYMGSAEFEFGAVPEAMQFIVNQAREKNLDAGIVLVGDNEPVYVICPVPYVDEACRRIKQMRKGELRLKESTMLDRYFEGGPWSKVKGKPDPSDQRICGWIEIDNGFMFFTDRNMWLQVCALFEITAKEE